MPPRGVKSAKRQRQYEHIKAAELDRGVGEDRAEEIAARTVNKQRRESGETARSASRGARASTRARKGTTSATRQTSSRPTKRAAKKR